MSHNKMSFDELKNKGNDFFKKQNYDGALHFYERALTFQTESEVIYSNMAAALLRLERFYEAYSCAEKALKGGSNNEKALYRLGKAAYGMQDWEKALDHFDELHKKFPECPFAVDELTKTLDRLEESHSGHYDRQKLYESHEKGLPCDAAEYEEPVEIVDIPGKGKGVVVNREVKKGTLLMASKAYAFVCDKEQGLNYSNDGNETVLKVPNRKVLIGNSSDPLAQELEYRTVEKLKKNPQTAKKLYALYAGSNLDRNEEILDGVIDIERIQKILMYNRIQPKIMFNSTMSIFGEEHGIGLWILPSYINNSCLSNAVFTHIGDVGFIHAVCDLKKGDEVTLSYLEPFFPYKGRQLYFQKFYNFICKCHLCELDRMDELMDLQREEIFNNLSAQTARKPPREALYYAAQSLVQMRQTYTNSRKELQIYLIRILSLMIGHSALDNSLEDEHVSIVQELYKVLGEPLKYTIAPSFYISAAASYSRQSKPETAKKILDEAFEIEKVRRGADRTFFNYIFSKYQSISTVGTISETEDPGLFKVSKKPEMKIVEAPVPLKEFFSFGYEGLSDKALAKLVENNRAQADPLNEKELKALEEIFNNSYYTITGEHVSGLEKGLKWSVSTITPILDVFCLAMLNDSLNRVFCSINEGKGKQTLRSLNNLLTSETPEPVRILVCRAFTNAAAHDPGREMLRSDFTTVVSLLMKQIQVLKSSIQLAATSALANLSLIMFRNFEAGESKPREEALLALIRESWSIKSIDSIETAVRLLQAIGTLLWNDPSKIKLSKYGGLCGFVGRITEGFVDKNAVAKSEADEIVLFLCRKIMALIMC